MELFDVYPLFEIEPVKAKGAKLWDREGREYLDLYGGHAVISIGHGHPTYVQRLKDQLDQIGFYSNAVRNSLQNQLARRMGVLSGYPDYQLFLCSTGAEANENALKLASFETKKAKVIAMKKAFHGRTSGAVATTDNPKVVAPFNAGHEVVFVEMNDENSLAEAMDDQVAVVIIEGLQGVAGIYAPSPAYLTHARNLCKKYGAKLILDEVQSGVGRTGEFFAHQHSGVKADIITVAKGLGNGFPVAAVLVSPEIKPWHGMLGTTFGGNHLACQAAITVLDVLEEEALMQNAASLGLWLKEELNEISEVKAVRGEGLMLAIVMDEPAAPIRKKLLMEHHIFTGSAADPMAIRILPPLNINKVELKQFMTAFKSVLA